MQPCGEEVAGAGPQQSIDYPQASQVRHGYWKLGTSELMGMIELTLKSASVTILKYFLFVEIIPYWNKQGSF